MPSTLHLSELRPQPPTAHTTHIHKPKTWRGRAGTRKRIFTTNLSPHFPQNPAGQSQKHIARSRSCLRQRLAPSFPLSPPHHDHRTTAPIAPSPPTTTISKQKTWYCAGGQAQRNQPTNQPTNPVPTPFNQTQTNEPNPTQPKAKSQKPTQSLKRNSQSSKEAESSRNLITGPGPGLSGTQTQPTTTTEKRTERKEQEGREKRRSLLFFSSHPNSQLLLLVSCLVLVLTSKGPPSEPNQKPEGSQSQSQTQSQGSRSQKG